MCIHTIYLCGICQTPVGRYTQTCPPPFQQASNHAVRYGQPYTLHPPALYSCPNHNCIASSKLHWALREQQAMAIQQGKGKLTYTPFHETKALCGDNDEASDLALEPVLVTKRKTHVQQALPAPEPVAGYPPIRPQGAQLRPEWLSSKEWQKVCALQSRGKNILEMAYAVNKNASKLRIYVDTYLKNASLSPLPSANSTKSSSSTTNSTSDSTVSSEGGLLFPWDQEVTVPQEGMPDPSFLSREEQEIVWKMFQQNNTVRNMASRLYKNRHKLSQYINAYMRPKLLKLQAEEREAENAPTPITPLAGVILQVPPSNPASPIAAATGLTPLAEEIPQSLPSQNIAAIATVPGPTSSQEPSLDGTNNPELDAFLYDPLLFNHLAAVEEDEVHETYVELALLETPKSFSDEDSLFGGYSPVDESNVGSPQFQLVSTHHEVEPAEPTPTPRKRKFEHTSEMPRRASKRLRNRSFS